MPEASGSGHQRRLPQGGSPSLTLEAFHRHGDPNEPGSLRAVFADTNIERVFEARTSGGELDTSERTA